MAFSGNNQSLYNQMVNGFVAGALGGKTATDPVQADYATLTAAAQVFATKLDSLIAADATLSAAGATVVPATAANQQSAIAKSHAMFGICFGYWFGRYTLDLVAADYTAGATVLAAIYAQIVAQYALSTGGTSIS